MRNSIAIAVIAELVVGAGLAVVWLTTVAVGNAQEVDLEGEGVIRYRHSEVLPNSVRSILDGRRLPDGGCEFESVMTLRPGQDVLQQREVAYDPINCRVQLETGEPVNSHVSTHLQGEPSGGEPPGPASGTLLNHSAGYWKGWFEDPVWIDVNAVTNSIDWRWDGICARAPWGATWEPYALQLTGWYLSQWDFTQGLSCTFAYSSTYAHYQNNEFAPSFCPSSSDPTHTYYNRNEVYGYFQGTLAGQTTWAKTGGCSNWLSFYSELRRTLDACVKVAGFGIAGSGCPAAVGGISSVPELSQAPGANGSNTLRVATILSALAGIGSLSVIVMKRRRAA